MSNINNLVNDWLDDQIVADYIGSIQDKWRVFLIQEGYTYTNHVETLNEYLDDEGYTGTFGEKYQQWVDAVIYA